MLLYISSFTWAGSLWAVNIKMILITEVSHDGQNVSEKQLFLLCLVQIVSLSVFLSVLAGWTESDGRSRAPAGLQHSVMGGPAHRLHHLLRRDHPSLRHPAAPQRQKGGPGAGFWQVRQPGPWSNEQSLSTFCRDGAERARRFLLRALLCVCWASCLNAACVSDWLSLIRGRVGVCVQSGAPAQPHPQREWKVHSPTGELTHSHWEYRSFLFTVQTEVCSTVPGAVLVCAFRSHWRMKYDPGSPVWVTDPRVWRFIRHQSTGSNHCILLLDYHLVNSNLPSML